MTYKNTNKKNPLKNEEGFTLLEIIAVIVIMSILAVVAVPKYFDLQEQARLKAFETGKSEAIGRVNGYFAQEILGGAKPTEINYTTTTLDGDNMGDFTFTVTGGEAGNSTTFSINIFGKVKTEMEDMNATITVNRPGI